MKQRKDIRMRNKVVNQSTVSSYIFAKWSNEFDRKKHVKLQQNADSCFQNTLILCVHEICNLTGL